MKVSENCNKENIFAGFQVSAIHQWTSMNFSLSKFSARCQLESADSSSLSLAACRRNLPSLFSWVPKFSNQETKFPPGLNFLSNVTLNLEDEVQAPRLVCLGFGCQFLQTVRYKKSVYRSYKRLTMYAKQKEQNWKAISDKDCPWIFTYDHNGPPTRGRLKMIFV